MTLSSLARAFVTDFRDRDPLVMIMVGSFVMLALGVALGAVKPDPPVPPAPPSAHTFESLTLAVNNLAEKIERKSQCQPVDDT